MIYRIKKGVPTLLSYNNGKYQIISAYSLDGSTLKIYHGSIQIIKLKYGDVLYVNGVIRWRLGEYVPLHDLQKLGTNKQDMMRQ